MKIIITALKRWWVEFNMSAEEAYLSKATSHAELEARMREIMDPGFNSTTLYGGFRR